MISERGTAAQRFDDVPADHPRSAEPAAAAVCARSRGRRRGSMPLARNAATMPVRTSPVPAVASAGTPPATRRLAGRADQRVRRLSAGRRSRTSRPRARAPRADARRPRPTRRRAAAPSSPECGVSTRRRVAFERLELVQASASTTAGRSPPRGERGRAPSASRRARAPSRAQSRARPRRRVLERPLDGLEDERLEHRQALRPARRSPRSPRRRGTRRRARHAAPVIPGEPPTTSTEPAVYLLSSAARRGTSWRISL